jgi:hypothetical protein
MAILILHAAVVIIYGKIMWNSIREGRVATSAPASGRELPETERTGQSNEQPGVN